MFLFIVVTSFLLLMGAYHRFPSPDVFIIADGKWFVKTFFEDFSKNFFQPLAPLDCLTHSTGFRSELYQPLPYCSLSIAQRHTDCKHFLLKSCTNSGFFSTGFLSILPIDKLRGKWYNVKFGAPQSSARRQNLVNTFFFVQNDEKPHPKMRFSARKKEREKGNGG